MRAPPAPPAASVGAKTDAPAIAAPVPGLDTHSDGVAPMELELDHDKQSMEKPLVQWTTRSSDRGRTKVTEMAVAVGEEVAVGAVAVVGTGPAEAAPSKIESSPPGEQSEASTPGSERRVRLRGAPALQQANGAAGAKRSGSPRRSPYGRRYDAIAGSSSNLTRALPFPSPAKSRRRGEVGLPTGREAVSFAPPYTPCTPYTPPHSTLSSNLPPHPLPLPPHPPPPLPYSPPTPPLFYRSRAFSTAQRRRNP